MEDTPDSPRRLQVVAPDVDAHAGSDATWRAELEAMVEEAKSGGVDGSLTQSA